MTVNSLNHYRIINTSPRGCLLPPRFALKKLYRYRLERIQTSPAGGRKNKPRGKNTKNPPRGGQKPPRGQLTLSDVDRQPSNDTILDRQPSNDTILDRQPSNDTILDRHTSNDKN